MPELTRGFLILGGEDMVPTGRLIEYAPGLYYEEMISDPSRSPACDKYHFHVDVLSDPLTYAALLKGPKLLKGLRRTPGVGYLDDSLRYGDDALLKGGSLADEGRFAASKTKTAPLTPRIGSISGNPANRLIETGTPLKNGTGWRRRWIRITEADELAQRQAIFHHYQELRDLATARGLANEARAEFLFKGMQEFRTNWLADFLNKRPY